MEKSDARKISESLLGSGGLLPSIMLIVIVIGAFFMGSLWTRVQVLEKGGVAVAPVAGNAPQAAPGPDVPQAAIKTPKLTADDHIRGDKNANLALIEYSDYECPFCKSFHPTMIKVMEEYKGKVKWVYRHYPLSFHANAQKQAEAAECIYDLGGDDAFWKYTDAIYERTTSIGTGFALDKLGPLAGEVGVDQAKFQTCLDSDKMAKKVKDQMAVGAGEGVTGTPGTIVLNIKTGETQLIPGALPFEQVKTTVDEMLK